MIEGGFGGLRERKEGRRERERELLPFLVAFFNTLLLYISHSLCVCDFCALFVRFLFLFFLLNSYFFIRPFWWALFIPISNSLWELDFVILFYLYSNILIFSFSYTFILTVFLTHVGKTILPFEFDSMQVTCNLIKCVFFYFLS